MDYIEMIYKVIEQQGIIAGLLLIKMWQSSRLNAKLISKNCELQRFIMQCLSKELDEDHTPHNSSQDSPRLPQTADLPTDRVFVSIQNDMSPE